MNNSNIIFLIGLGYADTDTGEWRYERFLMAKLDLEEERRVINNFKDFINARINLYKIANNIKHNNPIIPRLYHWSSAEVVSFNLANSRHNYAWLDWLQNIMWTDMSRIFTIEPIVVKSSFCFKLKDIAKNMYAHKLIKTTWPDSGISNGLTAMIEAIDYYRNIAPDSDVLNTNPNPNKKKYKHIMENIIKYNEVDCKVMWEILEYLYAHHI